MEGIVGFGFHPTNTELIGHHLRKKRLDHDFTSKKIAEINLYDHEPSELPRLALVPLDAPSWYFYVALNYTKPAKLRRASAKRRGANRRTRGGTWKVTGKVRDIKDSRTKEVIGTKRTMVFYKGRTTSPAARTNWVMHEFHCNPDPLFKAEFVVVRIRIKPDYKSDSSSTPSESESIHHLSSDSGDHTAVVSQESQPPSNHGISFNRESQPLPNYGISINGESQLLPNHSDHGTSVNGESQLLPSHGISVNREAQLLPKHCELLPLSLPNHDVFINRDSDQLLPDHGISVNRESRLLPNQSELEDERRNSQLAVQPGFYDEETGLSPAQLRNSQLAVQHGFYDEEAGLSPAHQRNFQLAVQHGFYDEETGLSPAQLRNSQLAFQHVYSSTPVTGAFVCDGTDADAEELDALLDGFSSMPNGEYDFNCLCQPQSFPTVNENILPVQMGSVV